MARWPLGDTSWCSNCAHKRGYRSPSPARDDWCGEDSKVDIRNLPCNWLIMMAGVLIALLLATMYYRMREYKRNGRAPHPDQRSVRGEETSSGKEERKKFEDLIRMQIPIPRPPLCLDEMLRNSSDAIILDADSAVASETSTDVPPAPPAGSSATSVKTSKSSQKSAAGKKSSRGSGGRGGRGGRGGGRGGGARGGAARGKQRGRGGKRGKKGKKRSLGGRRLGAVASSGSDSGRRRSPSSRRETMDARA